jgi:hypothetical protein
LTPPTFGGGPFYYRSRPHLGGHSGVSPRALVPVLGICSNRPCRLFDFWCLTDSGLLLAAVSAYCGILCCVRTTAAVILLRLLLVYWFYLVCPQYSVIPPSFHRHISHHSNQHSNHHSSLHSSHHSNHHSTITPTSFRHHSIITPSSFHQHSIIILSPFCHHSVTILSPFHHHYITTTPPLHHHYIIKFQHNDTRQELN